MVRFTNIAARILIGTQTTRYSSGYFPVISSIVRMLTCAAVLVSLVYHCEQVYRQRDRILDIIDYLLIYKTPSKDVKATASELRDLIQARPINFNMANFFRLDYSLLVSIASVVVTYTIILLQSIN
ncbi:uncharacterized protein [Epargyreus clarus]|uniref:uncharacterized protein n=1 Tax=Epargyreus clarus TaxID=520877 RepID=UPI003C2C7DEC